MNSLIIEIKIEILSFNDFMSVTEPIDTKKL